MGSRRRRPHRGQVVNFTFSRGRRRARCAGPSSPGNQRQALTSTFGLGPGAWAFRPSAGSGRHEPVECRGGLRPRPLAVWRSGTLLLVRAAAFPCSPCRPGRRRGLRPAFCEGHFTTRWQLVRLASGETPPSPAPSLRLSRSVDVPPRPPRGGRVSQAAFGAPGEPLRASGDAPPTIGPMGRMGRMGRIGRIRPAGPICPMGPMCPIRGGGGAAAERFQVSGFGFRVPRAGGDRATGWPVTRNLQPGTCNQEPSSLAAGPGIPAVGRLSEDGVQRARATTERLGSDSERFSGKCLIDGSVGWAKRYASGASSRDRIAPVARAIGCSKQGSARRFDAALHPSGAGGRLVAAMEWVGLPCFSAVWPAPRASKAASSREWREVRTFLRPEGTAGLSRRL